MLTKQVLTQKIVQLMTALLTAGKPDLWDEQIVRLVEINHHDDVLLILYWLCDMFEMKEDRFNVYVVGTGVNYEADRSGEWHRGLVVKVFKPTSDEDINQHIKKQIELMIDYIGKIDQGWNTVSDTDVVVKTRACNEVLLRVILNSFDRGNFKVDGWSNCTLTYNKDARFLRYYHF